MGSMRLVVLVIGMVVSIPTMAAQATSRVDYHRADYLIRKGEKAIADGDYAKAKKRFEQANQIVLNYPPAEIGLGHLAMEHSDYEAALEHYELAKDGFYRMTNEINRERMAQADAAEDRVTQLHTRQARMGSRAELLKREHELQQIEKNRKVPVADLQAPGRFDFFIGNALYQMGKLEEAIEAWERACEAEETPPGTYQNLAVGYLELDQPIEAAVKLKQAETFGYPIDEKLRLQIYKRIEDKLSPPPTPAPTPPNNPNPHPLGEDPPEAGAEGV